MTRIGADTHLLRAAVLQRGRVQGDLLLVDDFLNHRVEPGLMRSIGAALAAWFGEAAPRLVLTAEASGIAPALACSFELGVPMVYAKKFLGPGDRYSYSREVASPTKGMEYRVEVARRAIAPGTVVAIVDDFLARGRTAAALGEIVEEAGAVVAGCGFVVEKSFMPGRALIEDHGWPVHALVRVASLAGGTIALHPEDGL